MFKIVNASGANIGEVDYNELKQLMKDGIIKRNDTVIDMQTGIKVN